MVADRSLADDLAQDVFLKVHRGPSVLSRRSPALHLDLPHRPERVRAGAEHGGRADLPLEGDGDAPDSHGPSVADAAFGDLELTDRLEKAIAQLPEHYRLLIAAHYLRGVQYEALAETLEHAAGHGEDAPVSGEAAAAGVSRSVRSEA